MSLLEILVLILGKKKGKERGKVTFEFSKKREKINLVSRYLSASVSEFE